MGKQKGDTPIAFLQGKGRWNDAFVTGEEVIPHLQVFDGDGNTEGGEEREEEVVLLAQAVGYPDTPPWRIITETFLDFEAGCETLIDFPVSHAWYRP